MGGSRIAERLDLVVDGTAATALEWHGGDSVFAITAAPSGTSAALEMLIDAAWVPVSDLTGNAIVLTAIGMANFRLPSTRLRVTGTLTGISAIAVGI